MSKSQPKPKPPPEKPRHPMEQALIDLLARIGRRLITRRKSEPPKRD